VPELDDSNNMKTRETYISKPNFIINPPKIVTNISWPPGKDKRICVNESVKFEITTNVETHFCAPDDVFNITYFFDTVNDSSDFEWDKNWDFYINETRWKGKFGESIIFNKTIIVNETNLPLLGGYSYDYFWIGGIIDFPKKWPGNINEQDRWPDTRERNIEINNTLYKVGFQMNMTPYKEDHLWNLPGVNTTYVVNITVINEKCDVLDYYPSLTLKIYNYNMGDFFWPANNVINFTFNLSSYEERVFSFNFTANLSVGQGFWGWLVDEWGINVDMFFDEYNLMGIHICGDDFCTKHEKNGTWGVPYCAADCDEEEEQVFEIEKEFNFLDYFSILPAAIAIEGVSQNQCTEFDGVSTTLFWGHDNNIVRTMDLEDNYNEVETYLEDIDSWWGTCICCGILESNRTLNGMDSNPLAFKTIIVMSDGAPTEGCPGQLGLVGDMNNDGKSNFPDDYAINASCEIQKEGITVNSVCLGDDCNETTMRAISGIDCGYNGSYFKANASELADLYRQIASTLLNASFESQTIFDVDLEEPAILYDDSYIEFNYEYFSPPPQYGEITIHSI